MPQRYLKGDGSCACGCGGTPSVYTQRHLRDGVEPGDFHRFVAGHASRRVGDPRNAGPDYVEEDRGHTTPCWIWQRGLSHNGYGLFSSGGRAHAVLWSRIHGKVPSGKQLDHLCSVAACVNPDHLEAVVPTINVRRSRATQLTQQQVDDIRARAIAIPQVVLADEFGVDPSQISRIVNYKRWKDVV